MSILLQTLVLCSVSFERTYYDGKDLAFAGIYAKTLSQQLQNPTWNVNESDAALGQHLAEQYGALKTSAGSAGISEKLSNMLNSSFDPFMDRLMDSLDALIDQNRGWVAEKPWMSGTIIAIIKKPNNNQTRRTNGSSPEEKHKRGLSGWHPGGGPNCGFSSSAGWLSSWTTFSQLD